MPSQVGSKIETQRSMLTISAEKDTFKPGKVQIIGISPDPVEKQKLFVEKEKLTVCHGIDLVSVCETDSDILVSCPQRCE